MKIRPFCFSRAKAKGGQGRSWALLTCKVLFYNKLSPGFQNHCVVTSSGDWCETALRLFSRRVVGGPCGLCEKRILCVKRPDENPAVVFLGAGYCEASRCR